MKIKAVGGKAHGLFLFSPRRHQGTKVFMSLKTLSKQEENVARKIVDSAYAVHKALGPDLLFRFS